MVPGIAESKVMPRNFTSGKIFSVSSYSFRLSSAFLASADLEKIITLVFTGLSLLLHLAHYIANIRRSCCRSFAAIRTLRLKAY